MKDLSISPNETIKTALSILTKVGEKCLIVTNNDNRLLGTLSGGDLRKAILKGATITESIEAFFNRNPTYFEEGKFSKSQAKRLFIEKKFDLIPVINKERQVVDITFWEDVFQNGDERKSEKLDIPVVIMAGGKGTRLEPFTKILPKPLVPIHERPVIEHIIDKFTAVGISKFYLTVNYKSRILKAFFEELQPEYSIEFVDEQMPLGTAGSLQYLIDKIKSPFIVTNCDTIIDTDYFDLIRFHQKHDFDLTLMASAHEYIIPYGICELNGDGHLAHIREKPQYNFLVNIGLYVINPDILHLIPKNQPYDITHLIEEVKEAGKKVGVYPVNNDAWIDIGQWAEYRKAVERL